MDSKRSARDVCRFIVASIGLSTIFSAAEAGAQPPPPPTPPKPTADAGGAAAKGKTDAVQRPDASKRPEGWTPGIAIGGTFNLVDTRNVVGQMDGTTVTFGAAIDAGIEFNHGIHEWRNSLRAGAGITHTPSIGEFVKTNDGLFVETIYLAHPIEIFGPYARASLAAAMFPGMDIRPAAVSYLVSNVDGTTTEFIGRRLELTDPFEPLVLRQGIGAFVQPLNNDRIKLEAKAGLAAQEIVAEGLGVADDGGTPVIEVTQLDDSYAVGAEVVANTWGFFDETKRVAYAVGAGALFPFKTSDLPPGDDRPLGELISFEGHVALNVKLFDWASLAYKLSVVREPLLLDEWQVSNNLLLTIGAAFGSKAPEPPPPPPCDCATQCPPPPASPTPAPATPPPAADPVTTPAPATPPP